MTAYISKQTAFALFIAIVCAAVTTSPANADLLYEYDARDLSLGLMRQWDDSLGIASNARNWDGPNSRPHVVATGHTLFDQAVSFSGEAIAGSSSLVMVTEAFAHENSDFASGTDGRNAYTSRLQPFRNHPLSRSSPWVA